MGELALPVDRDPVATLICLHPLPTHGGMMDSQVFRKAAHRLPALAGLAVLRYNSRGTSSLQGTSEGAFDHAVGEQYDVAAAIEHAEYADLPASWLVGWSFGTDLALMHGLDPAIEGAKHLWVGDTERVLDEVVARVAPGVGVPLPRVWDGPMDAADTSAYADLTTAVFKDKPGGPLDEPGAGARPA